MFTKLLVANRGEIAVRIIRACKEMGIRTVAVYSKADAESIHVALADEAICIGEAAAKDSYLNQERIVSAAIASKAQAIHPGYGFLAENASFANLCKKHGIAFIGPSGDLIARMGDKDAARRLMQQSGVPTIPGTEILEDAAAAKAAKAVGYVNAGTVEFLMDKDKNFYFMEMNTRLQVEHPVSELVTGKDIVKWQIRIAAGVELDCTQDDIKVRGAAIECRINAGGVGKVNFLHIPSGPWVRFDTFLYQGYEVPPFYDSMLGKMIVFSSTREEAIRKMQSALCELVIGGLPNNIENQIDIIRDPVFQSGDYYTDFIKNREG